MVLTPEQIEGQEFVSTLRGCDRREVDAFLRVVAEDYRRILEERDAALVGAHATTVAPVEPKVELEDQVGMEVSAILRAGRDAAQRAREDGEREAQEAVRRAMARAEVLTGNAEERLAEAQARAAALELEAEERAREVLARADAGANAVLEAAEAQLQASSEEAATVVDQARAVAWETMQEARSFRDEVHEEAMATLARAQQDADAVRVQAEADRRQFLAMQAEAKARLSGTEAAIRGLLRRLDDAAEPFAAAPVAIGSGEPASTEPAALSVVVDAQSVAAR